MRLLDRLDRRFGRFSVPNITLGLIVCQALVFVLAMSDGEFLSRLELIPARVMEGEWWRVVTFLCVPPTLNFLFALLSWYVLYLMGTALEMFWGTFRYNVYLLLGYLANIGFALLLGLLGESEVSASNGFLQLTVFLAFAYLNPEFEFLLFFILPVKVKWLAWFTWIMLGISLVTGPWLVRLMVISSVANFLVFFGADIYRQLHNRQRRAAWESRQPNRKSKAFHRCEVCGITDVTNPDMTFRYCSQCSGARGYCSEHIHNHPHITHDEPASEAAE